MSRSNALICEWSEGEEGLMGMSRGSSIVDSRKLGDPKKRLFQLGSDSLRTRLEKFRLPTPCTTFKHASAL